MTTIDIDSITEEEAIKAFYDFSKKFGWAGTFFTREDASSTWEIFQDELAPIGSMPDDVWDKVTSTYYWRKSIPERLTEWGWDIVREAVEEAIGETP